MPFFTNDFFIIWLWYITNICLQQRWWWTLDWEFKLNGSKSDLLDWEVFRTRGYNSTCSSGAICLTYIFTSILLSISILESKSGAICHKTLLHNMNLINSQLQNLTLSSCSFIISKVTSLQSLRSKKRMSVHHKNLSNAQFSLIIRLSLGDPGRFPACATLKALQFCRCLSYRHVLYLFGNLQSVAFWIWNCQRRGRSLMM